jgi:hypothetical protein
MAKPNYTWGLEYSYSHMLFRKELEEFSVSASYSVTVQGSQIGALMIRPPPVKTL